MKVIKKLSAWILTFSLLFQLCIIPVNAGQSGVFRQIIYVDGVRFVYTMDSNGTITVKSSGKNAGTNLTIYSNGTTKAKTIDENGVPQAYDVAIKDLSKSEVDVDVYDKSRHKVQEYDDIDDLYADSYTGQAAMAVVAVPTLGLALKVFLAVTAAYVLSGIVYYVGAKAYESIKRSRSAQKYYYPASVINGNVYVAFRNPMSLTSAATKIKRGQSVYSFTSGLAKQAVKHSGYRCSRSEIDSNRKRGKIYFYHYHTNPKNGSHSWYGMPYTG